MLHGQIYKFVILISRGQIDDDLLPAIHREILIALTEAKAGKWPNPELGLAVPVDEFLSAAWEQQVAMYCSSESPTCSRRPWQGTRESRPLRTRSSSCSPQVDP
jgi:hypothetical protein